VSLRNIFILEDYQIKHYSTFQMKHMNKQLTNTSLKTVTRNTTDFLFGLRRNIYGTILSNLDIILNVHINSLFLLHVSLKMIL
jgi:hypothetical protein